MTKKLKIRLRIFMLKFKGVASCITAHSLKNFYFDFGINNFIQKGFYAKRSGDVAVVFEPGWMEYDKPGTTHGSSYSYDTHVPLIFYGWEIKNGNTLQKVEITDIAPTICLMMNINIPNACTGNIIEAITK